MRRLFHKLLSINLALIVFFPRMSFAVEGHYCADKFVDFSLFNNASWCGDQKGDSFFKVCETSEVSYRIIRQPKLPLIEQKR